VTLKGEVVGINTFAVSAISGAVRVSTLRQTLSSTEVTRYDKADPPADLLPVLSARYPTERLKEKIVNEPLDLKTYQLDAGKFTITALTPVLVGKVQIQADLVQARNRFQRRGRKVNDPTWREVDAPFYEWMRNAEPMLDNAVRFEVKPDFGSTAGSVWAAVLSGAAAGLSGAPVTPVHQTMEFKAEFQDFKLYRDGEFIPPIHPGRAVTEQAFQGPLVTFVDEAYSGMYVYTPDVFMKGKEFRMEVYDAREPGKPHRALLVPSDYKLIQQIRRDFAEPQTVSGPSKQKPD